MNDELWTRLERVVSIDDEMCACRLAGSMTCSRHALPPDTSTSQPAPRGAWRAAVAVAAALAVIAVGFGAARAMLAPEVSSAPHGAAVELPPMSLPTPARLALLGATAGCFAGGLSLGLTRRDRPARQRRVRPQNHELISVACTANDVGAGDGRGLTQVRR